MPGIYNDQANVRNMATALVRSHNDPVHHLKHSCSFSPILSITFDLFSKLHYVLPYKDINPNFFPSIPSLPARISLLRGSNLAKIRSSRGETLDESSTTSLGKCNSQSVPDISTYICTIYSVHAGSDSVCTKNYVL